MLPPHQHTCNEVLSRSLLQWLILAKHICSRIYAWHTEYTLTGLQCIIMAFIGAAAILVIAWVNKPKNVPSFPIARVNKPKNVPSSPTAPASPTRPSCSTSRRSSSYFFRSFDAAEYNSFLKSLPDERLRREYETIVSNLGANVGGAALHWGHAALTGGLTAPLSIAGTVVSGRKGYVNKRKLELVENELASRALRSKFGARGFARLAGNSLLTGATMGIHSG